MPRRLRTPLIYYGGKTRMADWIVSHMLPHVKWVDVFGGGAAVTLWKTPSVCEVYNDVGFVAHFFDVLRGSRGEELAEKLKLTLWSREEFEYSVANWKKIEDDVEKARLWCVLVNQGFTHEEDIHDAQWLMPGRVNAASSFANRMDLLPLVIERFRRIMVEHLDFEDLFPRHDDEDTLFYCDPPYVHETRSGNKGYVHEMPLEKHEELLWLCNEISGSAMVSGYDHPLYRRWLKESDGWVLHTKTHKSAIHNSMQLDIGDRTEMLWVRSNGKVKHGLWDTQPETNSQNGSRWNVSELSAWETA